MANINRQIAEELGVREQQINATVELLDATSLTVAQADPTARLVLQGLAVRDHAALLVEFQETSGDELADRVGYTAPLLTKLPLAFPAVLSRAAPTRAAL